MQLENYAGRVGLCGDNDLLYYCADITVRRIRFFSGTGLEKILRIPATELRARGQLPLDGGHRCLLHSERKRELAVGPPKRGKGTKICTDHSLPVAINIQSASPHESQLVEQIVGQNFLDELPERLIGASLDVVQLGCIKILLRHT